MISSIFGFFNTCLRLEEGGTASPEEGGRRKEEGGTASPEEGGRRKEECVRDWSGKPGTGAFNPVQWMEGCDPREDLQRKARPEGERPTKKNQHEREMKSGGKIIFVS